MARRERGEGGGGRLIGYGAQRASSERDVERSGTLTGDAGYQNLSLEWTRGPLMALWLSVPVRVVNPMKTKIAPSVQLVDIPGIPLCLYPRAFIGAAGVGRGAGRCGVLTEPREQMKRRAGHWRRGSRGRVARAAEGERGP